MTHPSIIHPPTAAEDLIARRREHQAIRYHMRHGMSEEEARQQVTVPKGVCSDCGAPAHSERARVCGKCRSRRSNESYARKLAAQGAERRTTGTGLSAHQAAALATPAKRKAHKTGKGAEPFNPSKRTKYDEWLDPDKPWPSDYRPTVTTTTRVENGVVIQRVSIARRDGLRNLFEGQSALEPDEIDERRAAIVDSIAKKRR
jgi:ribosomal protein S27AE